ncbi:periplasmic binding protein [Beutenbergia cavernae DSM 12333]|uniref:Periplasmic binding protein n=1 Tax=Beutenbergia cavernae (strain ATCC BAA-8 / DSM 12333 / CCUG 43141 / JCM 11478 / NBRC 16432 / NCIMB 13614 / HKI 0122) TaxID=471853 RepID=C5BVG8_BEUC1|nr:Fe2+-enterobactin ABC transporter substrate-binding protein [Beutenbergia cavernae]ACQ78408.1 periplasmic binding protein [Beutenbergia cavernae DSM 12333]
MRTTARAAIAVLATSAVLALSACSTPESDAADSTDAPSDAAAAGDDTGSWPRTVEHEAGTAEIPEQPLTIVSTSITLTGTLLAIDAPVTASAATSVSPLTDDAGFFTQWADVAAERGVEVLYPDLELDLEAIELAEPDLIIGSTIGADTTLEAYDQLNEIAPTIMLDYGSHSWQDLAATLGEATGLEEEADAVVETYDAWVAEQADLLELPEQPVTALAYNGADGGRVFSDVSAQADVLTALGFTYVAAPEELASEVRSDTSAVTQENLPAALDGVQTIFVAAGGDQDAAAVLEDPLLANQAAVAAGRVLPLGPTSFRIDYYSATDMVEVLVAEYGS